MDFDYILDTGKPSKVMSRRMAWIITYFRRIIASPGSKIDWTPFWRQRD